MRINRGMQIQRFSTCDEKKTGPLFNVKKIRPFTSWNNITCVCCIYIDIYTCVCIICCWKLTCSLVLTCFFTTVPAGSGTGLKTPKPLLAAPCHQGSSCTAPKANCKGTYNTKSNMDLRNQSVSFSCVFSVQFDGCCFFPIFGGPNKFHRGLFWTSS